MGLRAELRQQEELLAEAEAKGADELTLRTIKADLQGLKMQVGPPHARSAWQHGQFAF